MAVGVATGAIGVGVAVSVTPTGVAGGETGDFVSLAVVDVAVGASPGGVVGGETGDVATVIDVGVIDGEESSSRGAKSPSATHVLAHRSSSSVTPAAGCGEECAAMRGIAKATLNTTPVRRSNETRNMESHAGCQTCSAAVIWLRAGVLPESERR